MTTDNMVELKPCPFCDGPVHKKQVEDIAACFHIAKPWCPIISHRMMTVEQWNTRSINSTDGPVIDLDKSFWAMLNEAAAQSNWIPREHYFVNDWVADCCEYLRNGHPSNDNALREALADKARLDFLQAESDDLRCFSVPTGGDDADVGWRVIGHYQADPQERVIGEVFHDSVRDVIDAARAALKERGPYSDKFAALANQRSGSNG